MRRLSLFALIAFAACRQQGLQETKGALSLSPGVADFGVVYPGQARTFMLRLGNNGAPAVLKWTSPVAPFALTEDLPTEAPSGELGVTVRFAPAETGTFHATIQVEIEGLATATASLLGVARGIPECPAPSLCNETAFDLNTNTCVERPLANGVSCAGANVCLIDPTCVAGRCVGAEKSCDDANACTTDTCNAVSGCEHLPAPPCPGDGKCQTGVCDKTTGCGLARADDGTVCGPLQTCDAAEICIAGACVIRDPPDGYVCAQASPCQGEGLCVADVCERPLATPLVPTWSYDALTADAGVRKFPPLLHDFVLEPDGAMSLSGAFLSTPVLRRNTPQAREPAMGAASRCVLWNGRLICSKSGDAVNAVNLATGADLWSFNLRTARPDFKESSLFIARMAVQSSDRLATLWEAYPAERECRHYYLVILDASGAMVSAQQLLDPAFAICNHPHAYGFGADAAGHLFIAFAPTVKNPPLVSGAPTLLLSYSRDGIFRWKRPDVGLKGGELAIARGLLYPEHSDVAVLTSTGQPAFTLGEKFGRAVVTRERLIPTPQIGGVALSGYEAGSASLRWSHPLRAGQTFSSDQIRLASWTTRQGVVPIALTFTKENGTTQLHGIVARDGTEAFSCDVLKVSRTPPQMFEVADGTLAVMDGANGCNTCDPVHADKSAAFHTLDVPHVSRCTTEPWVGTYGGPGHDHREE